MRCVGWLVLGEVPSPLTGVGGAIALAGVALTARARRQPAARATVARMTSTHSAGSSHIGRWPQPGR